jgi:hypothetical protein
MNDAITTLRAMYCNVRAGVSPDRPTFPEPDASICVACSLCGHSAPFDGTACHKARLEEHTKVSMTDKQIAETQERSGYWRQRES